MMEEEKEQIVMVEFEGRRLFHVATTKNGRYFDFYAFDWSRRYRRHHYHMSGGGPQLYLEGRGRHNRYWLAEGYRVPGAWQKMRLARLPKPYALETLFDDNVQSDTVWCSRCQDHIPTDDTNYPCPHVWWCQKCDNWSTPSERCGHAERESEEDTEEEEPCKP